MIYKSVNAALLYSDFYDVSYMSPTRGFTFRKRVVHTGIVSFVYMPTVYAVL
jgi:hypothetical protein